MSTRRRGREVALQLLYALEITQADVEQTLAAPWVENLLSSMMRDFTLTLVKGVAAHRQEIDVLIQEASTNWALERIALVERNILRYAIYELVFMPEIPPNVTINEAVEVAKKYGTEDAPAFINGILDRVKRDVLLPAEAEHVTVDGCRSAP